MRTLIVIALVAAVGCGKSKPIPGEAGIFASKIDEFASRYDDGKNEIQKSQVFNEAREFEKTFFSSRNNRLAYWQGKLGSIRTTEGGKGLAVMIYVGRVRFWSGDSIIERRMIQPSDPVYQQVAKLQEGDCVNFVGEVVPKEKSATESGAMRNPEYDAILTSVDKCPN